MELGLALISEWRELIISLMEPCLMLAPVNDWVAPVATPFKEEKDPKKDDKEPLVRSSTAPAGLPEPPQGLPPPPPEPWHLGDGDFLKVEQCKHRQADIHVKLP